MRKINEFPAGWDEQRVRQVLEYYENQTDEEAAAEHETALLRPGHTLMEMPAELVPVFRQLSAKHQKKRVVRWKRPGVSLLTWRGIGPAVGVGPKVSPQAP